MNKQITGIKYCSFGGTSGYGQAAQTYMSALISLGYPITWHPLCWRDQKYVSIDQDDVDDWRNNETVLRPELAPLILREIEYSHVIMHVVPEYWPNFCEVGKVNVGYTTWEADELPQHWPPLLEQVDYLLLPSEFNRRVFEAELPNSKIFVLPHVIEEHQPSSDDVLALCLEKYNIDSSDTLFYSINTWTVRKNMAALLHAYLLAFEANDSVCLIIKTSQHGVRSRLSNRYVDVADLVHDIKENYPDPARVILIDDDEISSEELNALHDIGDCYVSLTHGEGWGMGAAEAASAGNPVIITGWSGQLDFLGDDYAGLLKYELTPAIDRLGAPSYLPHQSWAKPDISDAIDKMTSYAAQPEPWHALAQQHMSSLEQFSFNAVAQKLNTILQQTNSNDE